MKAAQFAMRIRLALPSLYLSRCYMIVRRDGTTYRFTDHDEDVVVAFFTGGETNLNGTYETVESPSPSALETDMELNVDNMELHGPMALQIDTDDIDAGLLDGADVWIFVVDWDNVAGSKSLRLRKGTVGEIKRFDDQYFFEVRGATQPLFEEVVDLYTAFCAADLGDAECNVQLEPSVWVTATAYSNVRTAKDATNEQATPQAVVKPVTQNDRWFIVSIAGTSGGGEPSWDTTIGNPTVDNTVTWETIRAAAMLATVASVTSQREVVVTLSTDAPDEFFTVGHARFETGLNAGLVIEIKNWDLGTKTVTCSLLFPFTIEVGDTLTLFAGCDKRRATCKTFDNIRNYRGFPDIPGQDETFRMPDAPEA